MSAIKEKLQEVKPLLQVILVLLLIASGGGVYFYSFIQQPNLTAIDKLEQRLAFVKRERQIWEEERQAKGVTEAEQLDFSARFNFLTKNEISDSRLIPMLLARSQARFNRQDMDFQNLTNLGNQIVDSYQRKQIALSGRATFSQFCHLLKWLENDLLAVVDSFDLPPAIEPKSWDKAKGGKLKASDYSMRPFNIIFHWVENVPRHFRSIPEFPPAVEVKHNPFKPSRMERIYDGKQPLPKDKIIYLPAPPELKLQGILAGRNGIQAMINNKIYRPGADTADGYTIFNISEDEVVIGRNNIRYRLKLHKKKR